MPLQPPLPTARTLVQHAKLIVNRTIAMADVMQVGPEPASKLLAKGFVLAAKIKIHCSQCLIDSGSLERYRELHLAVHDKTHEPVNFVLRFSTKVGGASRVSLRASR